MPITISGSSALCFSAVGYRDIDGGNYRQGTTGCLWASAVDGHRASSVIFGSAAFNATTSGRARGVPIRCVQN